MNVIQKKTKITRLKDYTQPGKAMSDQEFISMVRESDESGYMTPEEFKKKCLELRNTK